jgi:hypothetical protein
VSDTSDLHRSTIHACSPNDHGPDLSNKRSNDTCCDRIFTSALDGIVGLIRPVSCSSHSCLYTCAMLPLIGVLCNRSMSCSLMERIDIVMAGLLQVVKGRRLVVVDTPRLSAG